MQPNYTQKYLINLIFYKENNLLGHKRSDVEGDYKFWNVDKYSIVYKVENGYLEIVRILHGARDIDKILN